jgi:hypothetical protein
MHWPAVPSSVERRKRVHHPPILEAIDTGQLKGLDQGPWHLSAILVKTHEGECRLAAEIGPQLIVEMTGDELAERPLDGEAGMEG